MNDVIQIGEAVEIGDYTIGDDVGRNEFGAAFAEVQRDRAIQRQAQGTISRTRRVRFQQFLNEAANGQLSRDVVVREMSTSDFPLLFGDSIQRQLLGRYTDTPVSWPAYAKRGMVPDFRDVKRFAIDGLDAPLTAVAEGAEAPIDVLTESKVGYAVKLYRRKVKISFQAMVNDDLGAFRDIPARLADAARETEEQFAAKLLVDASGPLSTVFSSDNGNIITSNPLFSESAIETAVSQLGKMTNENGVPIVFRGGTILAGPALDIAINKVIHAVQVRNASGVSDGQVLTPNWIGNRLGVAINPYLPLVNTSDESDKCWFIVRNPGDGRPAMEIGFLQGMNGPAILQKQSNATVVNGSLPFHVDFDSLSVEWQLIHSLGGAVVSAKSVVGSSGSASA